MASEFPPTNSGWPSPKPDPTRQSFFESLGGEGKSSDRPDESCEFDGLALSSEVEDWGIERTTAAPALSDRSTSWMEPTPVEQVESINVEGAAPRRHVVESVTDESIALSSHTSSGHDDGWLLVSCPHCHGELEIQEDQLGVPGSCLWCETPIQALRSEDGEVVVCEIVTQKVAEIIEEVSTTSPVEETSFIGSDVIPSCPTGESLQSSNPWESGFSTWPAASAPESPPEISVAPEVAKTVPREAGDSNLEASGSGSVWGAPFEILSTPVPTSVAPVPYENLENIFSPVPHEQPLAMEDPSPDTGFGGFLQLAAEPNMVPSDGPAPPLSQTLPSMIQPEPLSLQPEASLVHPVLSPVQPLLHSIPLMPSMSQPGVTLDFSQSSTSMSPEQRIFGRFAESALPAPVSPPALPQPQSIGLAGLPSLPASCGATASEQSPAPAPFSAGMVRPAMLVVPKPKKSSNSLRTAFLVIVFGFVCGIALASFVLPTEEYADRARIYLDQFMAPQLRASEPEDPSQSAEAALASPVAPAGLPASIPAGPVEESLANPSQVAEPNLPGATP